MVKNAKIIAIIGLMGSGKTTFGAKLASEIGYYFIDLDQEIEDLEKRSINDIFAQEGEAYFRGLERDLIAKIIARDEKIVLSLGGGAFIDEVARGKLLESCLVVWLSAELDDILHRIGNKGNRPLLNNVDKRQVLQKLLDERSPIYALADLKLDSSKFRHDELIKQIYEKSKL